METWNWWQGNVFLVFDALPHLPERNSVSIQTKICGHIYSKCVWTHRHVFLSLSQLSLLRYSKIQTSHLSPEEAVSHEKGEYIGAVFRRNLVSNVLGWSGGWVVVAVGCCLCGHLPGLSDFNISSVQVFHKVSTGKKLPRTTWCHSEIRKSQGCRSPSPVKDNASWQRQGRWGRLLPAFLDALLLLLPKSSPISEPYFFFFVWGVVVF